MKNLTCFAVATFFLAALAHPASAQRKLDQKLKEALKRYPEADTNKDGVLSVKEARALRAKMKGGKASDPLAGQKISTGRHAQPVDLKNGARCLFLGHSFFIPVAKRFDEIAVATKLPNHHVNFVMSGGGGGAPGRIWQSKPHRAAATKVLETGNVHLLGMTYYDESNCRVEDYERWINLAVEHNPKVHIFIGLCWPDAPQASMDDFDEIVRLSTERLFKTVKTLRSRHPKTQIQFVNYGLVARELKYRHTNGRLPEIKSLVARDNQALFRDTKGHAGPLLLEVAALTWLQQLYGVDVTAAKADVAKSRVAKEVLPVVAKFNHPFRSK